MTGSRRPPGWSCPAGAGTGKSYLLIGAGVTACEQHRPLRYVSAAGLVNELVEAADERALSRTIARYARLDLLLVDELAIYTPTTAAGSCCSQ